jgi:quinol monooxygenase YgiN
MPEDIYFNCVFDVKSGQFDKLRTVISALAALSEKEAGCLAYECSANADRSKIYMIEHFRDSAAILHHIAESFMQHAEAWGELVSVSSFVVIGSPTDEVRNMLPPEALYVERFDGFTK